MAGSWDSLASCIPIELTSETLFLFRLCTLDSQILQSAHLFSSIALHKNPANVTHLDQNWLKEQLTLKTSWLRFPGKGENPVSSFTSPSSLIVFLRSGSS